MARRRRRQTREAARRQALRAAAVPTTQPALEGSRAGSRASAPAPLEPPERGRRHRRGASYLLVGVAAASLIGIAILAVLSLGGTPETAVATPSSTIVVGIPGGEVTSHETLTPSSTPAPTLDPTPIPTEAPTHAPGSAPTAVTTPTPQPAIPAPAPPAPPSTPQPTPVIVAVSQPDDAVAAFYAEVASGDFDSAYALWSERMKVTYPRQENLDDRFAHTTTITFHELFVAAQGPATATVQANFTETYDSGATRDFVGYWELIRVDGRWLLDEPHY